MPFEPDPFLLFKRMGKTEDDSCLVIGETIRAFRKVELGKLVQWVITKDEKGQPRRSLSVMVREVGIVDPTRKRELATQENVSAKEAAAPEAPPVGVRLPPTPAQPFPVSPAPRK